MPRARAPVTTAADHASAALLPCHHSALLLSRRPASALLPSWPRLAFPLLLPACCLPPPLAYAPPLLAWAAPRPPLPFPLPPPRRRLPPAPRLRPAPTALRRPGRPPSGPGRRPDGLRAGRRSSRVAVPAATGRVRPPRAPLSGW